MIFEFCIYAIKFYIYSDSVNVNCCSSEVVYPDLGELWDVWLGS
jgi:hypothetical protein